MRSDNPSDQVFRTIDNRRAEIIELGERIYRHPEAGFKEFDTARLVAERLRGLGLACIELTDIPGVKATVDTGKDGPGVAIIGEMDAILCPDHPDSSKETGAVHACGHHAQIAAMFGAAVGLLDASVLRRLAGKIHFLAVPAEECIEIAYRNELRAKGVIRYMGGKPELLHRGLFDGVDLCMMVHVIVHADLMAEKKVVFEPTANGCLAKKIRYIGRAAHAGASPHEGINALYAANLGMAAINSLRETFREKEFVRVHPIITKGGDVVNVIPSEVCLETFVRGKTMDDILRANKKINRALIGGAIAMGAKVEIEDIPGYYPLTMNPDLVTLTKDVVTTLINEDEVENLEHMTGSTDLGDLSALMPVIQPYIGGCTGVLHSIDFRVSDPETAYILAAKILAGTAVKLLAGNAAAARDILARFKPVFKSKEEYFSFSDGLFRKKTYPEGDIGDGVDL